jgi:hypothetical protein
MQRAIKSRVVEFVLRPLFIGIGFIVKMVYSVTFAWWLDPWMQRKANVLY